jgi:sugar phosphate isomerase/epimerase
MRFGIMTMQIETLIPSGLPVDQMLAHISDFDYAQLVRSMSESGFRTIELGGDLTLFLPTIFQQKSIEALSRVKEELDLSYTVHLPLWSVEPSTPLEPVRRGSANAIVDCIRSTTSLNPEVYVFHATGALAAEFYRMNLPEIAREFILHQFKSNAAQSLKQILAETGIPSRKIAIETIEFPFGLTLDLAEELDLSLCLDTGHVLSGFSGTVTVEEVLEASMPRLAEVHLHDSPQHKPGQKINYGQDHRPLGTGDLNLEYVLDRLVAAEFQGPVIFELQLHEALESLKVIRALRPGLPIE